MSETIEPGQVVEHAGSRWHVMGVIQGEYGEHYTLRSVDDPSATKTVPRADVDASEVQPSEPEDVQ